MTRLGWVVMAAMSVVLAVLIGLFVWDHARTEAPAEVSTQATSTDAINPSTLSIYTSGEYGFSLFYPSGATLTDAYTPTALSGITWKAGATATGTAVVRIQKGNEEVRVGLSKDTAAVRNCIAASPAETTNGTFQIGSTTWHTFSFQKVGTDNEQRVTSYRIVHDSSCYALELFQPLSGMASTTDYTLGDTITSFNFSNS